MPWGGDFQVVWGPLSVPETLNLSGQNYFDNNTKTLPFFLSSLMSVLRPLKSSTVQAWTTVYTQKPSVQRFHILKTSEKQYYVASKNILKEIKQGIIHLMIFKKWLSNWPGILKEEQNKTFRKDKKLCKN